MSDADRLLSNRAKATLGAKAEELLRGGSSDASEPDEPSRAASRVRLLRLSDVDEKPVPWLWPNRLPLGKLVLLEGHPSVGKSTLVTAIAAAVSTGGRIAGHSLGEPRHVVLMSYEDSPADTIIPRLLAAGGDPSRVHLAELEVSKDLRVGLQLPTHILELEQSLSAKEIVPAMVVADPLGEAMSQSVDSHRESEVRHALASLTAFASRTGACVVLVRHLRKQATGRAVTSGSGSIGFTAAARVVLRLDEYPEVENGRILSTVKNNLARVDRALSFEISSSDSHSAPLIRWTGEVDWSADELDAKELRRSRAETSDVQTWLKAELRGRKQTSRDLHRQGASQGFSRSSIERAATALGVLKRASGMGSEKVSIWRLPEVEACADNDASASANSLAAGTQERAPGDASSDDP